MTRFRSNQIICMMCLIHIQEMKIIIEYGYVLRGNTSFPPLISSLLTKTFSEAAIFKSILDVWQVGTHEALNNKIKRVHFMQVTNNENKGS